MPTVLTILSNILVVLLSLIIGVLLLRLWWTVISGVYKAGGRVYFEPGWWRPSVVLVLGLVFAVGPFVSMYVYYRQDRQETSLRNALVDAHNNYAHRHFVDRYNLAMSSVHMSAFEARIHAEAYARSGRPLSEKFQEHLRHLDRIQDTFLVRFASIQFAEVMGRRPLERGRYFLAGIDLSHDHVTLDQTVWAHRTDSSVFGLVKVELGRYVFDGFKDSALVAAR